MKNNTDTKLNGIVAELNKLIGLERVKKEIYQLTLHALRYEKLTTPLGTFDTIVYEPRMEKTPPQGMFKKGSTVRVWIAQDETRLPVRFQVDFKFGAGVATLVSHDGVSAEQ